MNVYSEAYIPRWLEVVNTAIGTTERSVKIEPLAHQRQRYIQSFSGSDVWERLWDPEESAIAVAVNPDQFLTHMGYMIDFVQQEWLAKSAKEKSWNRFNVKIEPYKPAWSPSSSADHEDTTRLYQCTVPGIQEFTPIANIGDVSGIITTKIDRSNDQGC